jgi:hypothetical protein
VLASYSSAKFELLRPYDVNFGTCYYTSDVPDPGQGFHEHLPFSGSSLLDVIRSAEVVFRRPIMPTIDRKNVPVEGRLADHSFVRKAFSTEFAPNWEPYSSGRLRTARDRSVVQGLMEKKGLSEGTAAWHFNVMHQ